VKRLPRLLVLVGLPGSGKSTWAKQQGLPTISSDAIRELLADDVTDQTIHRQVFQTVRFLVRQRLAIGRPVTCVDATHLTPRERRPYFRIRGCRVEAVFFDVPVELCQQRNAARQRVVPPDVIERMAARLVKPARREGFSKVWTVTP
jgi:predicted kinase